MYIKNDLGTCKITTAFGQVLLVLTYIHFTGSSSSMATMQVRHSTSGMVSGSPSTVAIWLHSWMQKLWGNPKQTEKMASYLYLKRKIASICEESRFSVWFWKPPTSHQKTAKHGEQFPRQAATVPPLRLRIKSHPSSHDFPGVHPNHESKIRRCHEPKHTAVRGSQGDFLSGKPGCIPRTPTDVSGTAFNAQPTNHYTGWFLIAVYQKRCSSCHWDFICLSWVRYNPAVGYAIPFTPY